MWKIYSDEELAKQRAQEKVRVARYLKTDKAKATRHAYYLAHAATIKQRTRDHSAADPDRKRANAQAYYLANKAEIEQKVRDWNAANPEATRSRGRNYRARMRGAKGSHTGDDIKALYAKQGGLCVYCSKPLGKRYHVDHIKPLSRGGSNWPRNLQLLCGPCNNHKRATDPAEFLRRLKVKPRQQEPPT